MTKYLIAVLPPKVYIL